jgi:hypothetical protein
MSFRSRSTVAVCALMFLCAPGVRSQEKVTAPPDPGASSAKATATVEEPEASTSEGTEALQKATQNPVASLISVPVQDNTNFGVNPGYRTQNVLNLQPVNSDRDFKRLEPDHPVDHTDRLPAAAQSARDAGDGAVRAW